MKKIIGLFIIILFFSASLQVFGSEREEFFSMGNRKMWSMGFNIGTAFATPLLMFNINATIAPLPFSFLEFGAEFGSILGMAGENVRIEDVAYKSNYIYARVNIYTPIGKRKFDSYGKPKESGGWHLGFGLGLMNAEYAFIRSSTERTVATVKTPTFGAETGFYIGRGHILFKAGYAIRATMDMKNLIGVNHRILLGVLYRVY